MFLWAVFSIINFCRTERVIVMSSFAASSGAVTLRAEKVPSRSAQRFFPSNEAFYRHGSRVRTTTCVESSASETQAATKFPQWVAPNFKALAWKRSDREGEASREEKGERR